MGKRRAEGRPYGAAGMESDASARLKRLTRAELIKLVTKLETPAAIVEREPGGEEKPLAPHQPTMLVNGSIRSGQIVRFERGALGALPWTRRAATDAPALARMSELARVSFSVMSAGRAYRRR